MKFKNQRDAAAWMICQGRALLASNLPISEYISRKHNNATFEMGFRLIEIGRMIAMGYEMDLFTRATYMAHVRATSPMRKKGLPHGE